MTTKNLILSALISSAANEGETDVVQWLALQFEKPSNPPEQIAQPKATVSQPLAEQPSLPLSGPSSRNDIARVIRKYVSDHEPGEVITFVDVRDYVASSPEIVLDLEFVETEKRERWRQHVSNTLVRLRSQGILGMTGKSQHYVILRKP